MKTRKIPFRKCISCNENKNKSDLIRIVKNKNDEVFVDSTGKMNGRGAYLCRSLDCLENAKKTGRLSRVLSIKIEDSIYDEIENIIK